jgi:DMSO/TMAO reductase YedYZ molybdopterin-dependent catalytic subunit
MTSKTNENKLNTKLIASIIIIIIIVLVSTAAVAAEYMLTQPPKNNETPAVALSLIGSSGQTMNLTYQDILALESYSAQGGYKTSGGALSGIGNYTGVPVTTLLNLVGGMTSGQTLTATASDGYTMTYTYNQAVNGQDLTTFSPVTGSQATATQPLKMVLTYSLNGTTLSSEDGPLRIGIFGSEGLLTQGNLWVKMVTQLEITGTSPTPTATPTQKPTATPTAAPITPTPTPTPDPALWTLNFNGGKSIGMTDTDFATQASQHAATWNQNDSNGNSTWEGTPLYQLINYYATSGGISYGVLSLGYNVTVVGSDGYAVVLNGTRVAGNDNIIIANKANGTALTSSYYPLTLTGSNMTKRDSVKGIAQIQINTLLPNNITLTIKGTTGTTIVFNTNDIAALPSVSGMAGFNSHGAIAGVGNYTGISIPYLINLVGGMPNNNTFLMLTAADGFTKTYSYQQVIDGTGYTTYNQITNAAQTATQPITPILAYAINGTVLPTCYKADGSLDTANSDIQGPLRSAFIGPEGLLTVSNMWVKMTVEIDVDQLA